MRFTLAATRKSSAGNFRDRQTRRGTSSATCCGTIYRSMMTSVSPKRNGYAMMPRNFASKAKTRKPKRKTGRQSTSSHTPSEYWTQCVASTDAIQQN